MTAKVSTERWGLHKAFSLPLTPALSPQPCLRQNRTASGERGQKEPAADCSDALTEEVALVGEM